MRFRRIIPRGVPVITRELVRRVILNGIWHGKIRSELASSEFAPEIEATRDTLRRTSGRRRARHSLVYFRRSDGSSGQHTERQGAGGGGLTVGLQIPTATAQRLAPLQLRARPLSSYGILVALPPNPQGSFLAGAYVVRASSNAGRGELA